MARYLLFFLVSMTVFGQDVYEELTVTYKDIRVHVLDQDGNPVKNLKREDFILRERRKNVDVSYFEEVDLTQQIVESEVVVANDEKEAVVTLEEAPDTVDRFMIFFVDSSHMTPGNFKRVKTAIREFIDERVTDRDFVKIVHMDRRFQHLTGFTKDKDILKNNLEKARFEGRQRRDLITIQRSINGLIEEWDIQEDANLRPSLEQGINQIIREKARLKYDYFRTFYLNMLSMANALEYIKGAKSVFLFTGGGYLEFNSFFNDTVDTSDKLGRIFNRANATVYTMLFATPQTLGGDGNNLNLRSVPPNFARQLTNYSQFPPSDEFTDPSANTIVENNNQLESAPSAAAENTGGLYLKTYNADDATAQLRQLNDVSRHYYRLGYAVDDPDKRVKVTVRLKDKPRGWKLLYGSDFQKEEPYIELKKEEKDMAFKAMMLYSQTFRDDLQAEWDHFVYTRKSGGYRIPFTGRIPVEELPEEGYEIGFAALDENKEMLDLITMQVKDIPIVGKTFQFYDNLLVETYPRYLRASIRNMDNGELSFMQFDLGDNPAAGQSGTRVAGLILAAKETGKSLGLNHVRMIANNEGLELEDPVQAARRDEDPFNLGGSFFSPEPRPYVFQPGPIWFMFHVEEPLNLPNQVQFLVRDNENVIQVPGAAGKKFLDEGHSLHVQYVMNASKLPPGEYQLFVRVVYPNREPVMASAPFSIGNGKEKF